ncbi:MAG: hypothetical protein AMXMBFR59_37750 [Rhodanobacteraceae bacterium]
MACSITKPDLVSVSSIRRRPVTQHVLFSVAIDISNEYVLGRDLIFFAPDTIIDDGIAKLSSSVAKVHAAYIPVVTEAIGFSISVEIGELYSHTVSTRLPRVDLGSEWHLLKAPLVAV